jgi:Protein of unknown function (DUF1232)
MPSSSTSTTFRRIDQVNSNLAEWIFSGSCEQIDRFIEQGCQQVRSEDLGKLVENRQQLFARLHLVPDQGYNDFKIRLRQAIRILMHPAVIALSDPLPQYLAELTFAAQYLLDERELIPDQIPGLGLADDAILLERVFARNAPELERVGPSNLSLTLGRR